MKTELVEGIAQVAEVGFACIGVMAWESPFIRFIVYANTEATEGREVLWHTDNIDKILFQQDKLYHTLKLESKWLDFSALIRGNRVWRIRNIKYR